MKWFIANILSILKWYFKHYNTKKKALKSFRVIFKILVKMERDNSIKCCIMNLCFSKRSNIPSRIFLKQWKLLFKKLKSNFLKTFPLDFIEYFSFDFLLFDFTFIWMTQVIYINNSSFFIPELWSPYLYWNMIKIFQCCMPNNLASKVC